MRRSSGWVRKWVRVWMGVRGSQGRGGRRGGRGQHDWGGGERRTRASKRVPVDQIIGGERNLVRSLDDWNAAIQISTAQSARWHHVGARVNGR